MKTCRMCGARLTDENDLDRHNEVMHPNMPGKKGGEVEGDIDEPRKPEPDRDRPID